MELIELAGVGAATEGRLMDAGIYTVEELAGSEEKTVPGIPDRRLAELVQTAQDALAVVRLEPVDEETVEEQIEPLDEDTEEQVEAAEKPPGVDVGALSIERPPYWRLTFLRMKDRPDVGRLDVRGYLFTVGVPQSIPRPDAEAILARTQYEFDVVKD